MCNNKATYLHFSIFLPPWLGQQIWGIHSNWIPCWSCPITTEAFLLSGTSMKHVSSFKETEFSVMWNKAQVFLNVPLKKNWNSCDIQQLDNIRFIYTTEHHTASIKQVGSTGDDSDSYPSDVFKSQLEHGLHWQMILHGFPQVPQTNVREYRN
jgi:hypothetical protein